MNSSKIIVYIMTCFVYLASYAEGTVIIPVVPDKQSNVQKNNSNAIQSTEDPIHYSPNQETVNSQFQLGTQSENKSSYDLISKIQSAEVDHYGGETGMLRVRLRGARAFEPSYYFDGLPLTAASTGEQNISLLPSSYIGSLEVYPDVAPFGLSTAGISGDVNILPCDRFQCFFYGKSNKDKNLFKGVTRIGNYGYFQGIVSNSLKLSDNTELYTSLQYTHSDENYPYFNNNNSIIHADHGTWESLQNNDYSQVNIANGGKTYSNNLGKLSWNLIFTHQNKGIPGAYGDPSDLRIKNDLFLTNIKSQKILANTGIEWNTQIAGLYNVSDQDSSLKISSAQTYNAKAYNAQIKTWVNIPNHFFLDEQTGIYLEFLKSFLKTSSSMDTNTNSITNESSRTELRPALFEGMTIPLNDTSNIAWSAYTWGSFSTVTTDSIYSQQKNTSESPIYGYTLSLQGQYKFAVLFTRYVLSERRPYLTEFYGAPGGIIANSSLNSEQSKKIELGLSSPYLEVGFFHADDTNLIFMQQLTSVSVQYQNLQSGYRDGLYLNGQLDFLKYFGISGNYQYLTTKTTINGQTTMVPRSSKNYLVLNGTLKNIPLGNYWNHQSAFLGAYTSIQYESPFYLDSANTMRMDIPSIFNTGTSISLNKNSVSTHYMVSIDVYNVTDERFSTVTNTSSGTVVSANTNGYFTIPPSGRRYFVSFTGEF